MMPGPMRVAVVGATGFIGSATVQALQMGGHAVVPVKAPRLASLSERSAAAYIESRPRELGRLIELLGNCDSVVNAAGLPDATSGDSGQQIAVNGVLPGLIAAATCEVRARRLVHVSSAAVQGRRLVLDETDEFDDFSPYSHSKRLGE